MRRYTFLSLVLFILGIFFLLEAYLRGDLGGGLLLIFPFIYGSGLYAVAGSLLVFLSIVIFSFGSFYDIHLYSEEQEEVLTEERSSKSGGAVVMIGPIPIVIASDMKLAVILFFLSIVFLMILIITFFQL